MAGVRGWGGWGWGKQRPCSTQHVDKEGGEHGWSEGMGGGGGGNKGRAVLSTGLG